MIDKRTQALIDEEAADLAEIYGDEAPEYAQFYFADAMSRFYKLGYEMGENIAKGERKKNE